MSTAIYLMGCVHGPAAASAALCMSTRAPSSNDSPPWLDLLGFHCLQYIPACPLGPSARPRSPSSPLCPSACGLTPLHSVPPRRVHLQPRRPAPPQALLTGVPASILRCLSSPPLGLGVPELCVPGQGCPPGEGRGTSGDLPRRRGREDPAPGLPGFWGEPVTSGALEALDEEGK